MTDNNNFEAGLAVIELRGADLARERYHFAEMSVEQLRLNQHKNVYDVRDADPLTLLELAASKANEAIRLVTENASAGAVARACADGANYFCFAQMIYLYLGAKKAVNKTLNLL